MNKNNNFLSRVHMVDDVARMKKGRRHHMTVYEPVT